MTGLVALVVEPSPDPWASDASWLSTARSTTAMTSGASRYSFRRSYHMVMGRPMTSHTASSMTMTTTAWVRPASARASKYKMLRVPPEDLAQWLDLADPPEEPG